MDVGADEEATGENEVAYRALSFGRVAEFFQRISLPVFALPGRRMFRVSVHGHGFEVPVKGSGPILGFYSTCYVSAKTPRHAEEKALETVQIHWTWFSSTAKGQLIMNADKCLPVKGRFKMRSHYGFTFYGTRGGDGHPD